MFVWKQASRFGKDLSSFFLGRIDSFSLIDLMNYFYQCLTNTYRLIDQRTLPGWLWFANAIDILDRFFIKNFLIIKFYDFYGERHSLLGFSYCLSRYLP